MMDRLRVVHASVEREPMVAGPQQPLHARARQLERPDDIGRVHEVPRGPEDVRAENLARRERTIHGLQREATGSQCKRPCGPHVVLSLHGPHPRHERPHVAVHVRASFQPLIAQARFEETSHPNR
jgi:hypothetical protein